MFLSPFCCTGPGVFQAFGKGLVVFVLKWTLLTHAHITTKAHLAVSIDCLRSKVALALGPCSAGEWCLCFEVGCGVAKVPVSNKCTSVLYCLESIVVVVNDDGRGGRLGCCGG